MSRVLLVASLVALRRSRWWDDRQKWTAACGLFLGGLLQAVGVGAGPAPPVGRWAGGPVGRWAGGPVGRWAGGPVGRWAGG
ncbi:hypothetical protein, partial [Streptomyces sp. NPDC008150]|uniref:hypothetical protein n=1 Tax=Streptomyces sp. NPDC008150 TaxID=3364816 RepID=UPI0036EABD4A